MVLGEEEDYEPPPYLEGNENKETGGIEIGGAEEKELPSVGSEPEESLYTSNTERRGNGKGRELKEKRQREVQSQQQKQQQQQQSIETPRTRRRGRTVVIEDQAEVDRDPSRLPFVKQIQRQAREASGKLKSPPKQKGPQWTAEHYPTLSNNIQLLINASSGPREQNHDDDGDNDYQEAEEETTPTQTPTRRRRRATPGQHATSGRRAAAGQSTAQGRKRQREEGSSPDLGDPKELNSQKSRDYNVPDTNGPTAGNQRPWKRLKLRTGISQNIPVDLATLQPQPLQLQFDLHPDADRSDSFFVGAFRKLFRRIFNFSQAFFGIHDLDEGEFHQPWVANIAPEFVSFVEQVAEADPAVGGWENLLRDTQQRRWLIIAVIMRILEVQVFQIDLWGADQQEKELLLGIERALLTREGFSRTALRATTVRTILGQGAITRYFHSEVAQLTARVALLLKPLSDFLYSMPPKEEGKANPQITAQYQEIHNIISKAAYLSICIRLSPTIFYFTDITPNTSYDPEDQHSLDNNVYTKSKDVVVKAHVDARTVFLKEKKQIDKELSALKKTGKGETTRAYKKAIAKQKAHRQTQPYPPPGSTHRALTKIGVWPCIRRFKPGTDADVELQEPLAKRDGFRIRSVSKGAVVCYFGVEDRKERAKTRVRLTDFVKQKKEKYGKKEPGFGKFALVAGVAVAAGLFYGDAFKLLAGDRIEGLFATLASEISSRIS